jgi:hypothetical protein
MGRVDISVEFDRAREVLSEIVEQPTDEKTVLFGGQPRSTSDVALPSGFNTILLLRMCHKEPESDTLGVFRIAGHANPHGPGLVARVISPFRVYGCGISHDRLDGGASTFPALVNPAPKGILRLGPRNQSRAAPVQLSRHDRFNASSSGLVTLRSVSEMRSVNDGVQAGLHLAMRETLLAHAEKRVVAASKIRARGRLFFFIWSYAMDC